VVSEVTGEEKKERRKKMKAGVRLGHEILPYCFLILTRNLTLSFLAPKVKRKTTTLILKCPQD
jgi:hypothetical protein